jgi:hypothetical protein
MPLLFDKSQMVEEKHCFILKTWLCLFSAVAALGYSVMADREAAPSRV